MKRVTLKLGSATGAALLCLWVQAVGATVLYDNITAASNSAYLLEVTNPIFNSFSTLGTSTALSQFNLLLDALNPSDGGNFGIAVLNDLEATPRGPQFLPVVFFRIAYCPPPQARAKLTFHFRRSLYRQIADIGSNCFRGRFPPARNGIGRMTRAAPAY